MKLPKNFYLSFEFFFTINLIYSLVRSEKPTIILFPVNIWVYRAIVVYPLVFIKIYFKMRANDSIKQNR
jgi:hypothetical protein